MPLINFFWISVAMLGFVLNSAKAETKPRARDLGIPLDGMPGVNNALIDVPGIEVGHVTYISGQGKLKVGKGPIRTGVTAILPRGKNNLQPVFAGFYALNGNGEMTGIQWVEESGLLEGPIMLTSTHSVGAVHEGVIRWQVDKKKYDKVIALPVIAETWDGFLNDLNGFHIKPKHAIEAIQNASRTNTEEGSIGGGTAMICFELKCGVGTSSQIISIEKKKYTLASHVQANFGLRKDLTIRGKKILPYKKDHLVYSKDPGSIIVVIATDAPLLPHQLKRLARRAALSLGRLGSVGRDSSGDLFVAFSTADTGVENINTQKLVNVSYLPNAGLDPIFEATVNSIEESILNALLAGEPMEGIDKHFVDALPHELLRKIFK